MEARLLQTPANPAPSRFVEADKVSVTAVRIFSVVTIISASRNDSRVCHASHNAHIECVFVRLQIRTAEAPNAYATRRSMLPSFAFRASIVSPWNQTNMISVFRVVTSIAHSAGSMSKRRNVHFRRFLFRQVPARRVNRIFYNTAALADCNAVQAAQTQGHAQRCCSVTCHAAGGALRDAGG
jgi:hypothetical protein